MERPGFVDSHSHVCPSGDDGAPTVAEGGVLCREAARHGTEVLFATPHVWPQLTLTPGRERRIRESFLRLRERAGLELRLGFELTPTRELLRDDLRRYALEGTDCLLMEVPFVGPADLLVLLAERAEAAGLQPVIAHPERCESVLERPALAAELAGRGWLLQVNGSSLVGRHGPAVEALAWELVEGGLAGVVGSDGHRRTRPPHLDEAWSAVAGRIGAARARPLFDGSPLGVATAPRRIPSRAATRGA